MLRRIIQVTSVALLAIAMAVLGLLLNLLAGSRLLTEWLNHQRWYSLRNLVLALVMFVVITVVLQLLQQAGTQAKKEDVAGDRSLPIDPSVRVDLLNRVKT
jgi:H+/Cl- antiporter ClcA